MISFHKVQSLIKESEFLRPSVLLAVGTLILLLFSQTPLSAKAGLVVFFSILLFFAGEHFSKKFRPAILVKKEILFYFGIALILISLAALYLNFFAAGGIPLFNSAIRRFLSAPLTYASFLIVPGIIFAIASFDKLKTHNPKLKTIFLIFFAAGMMSLLGFRTEVLAAILGGTFAAYYAGIFDIKELAALFLIALIAFSGVSIVRDASSTFGRLGTTMATFNNLAEYTPIVGGLTHGYVQFADFHRYLSRTPIYSGRVLLSSIIGSRVTSSTTATIFAPPFVDFGAAGMLMFLFFGAVLGAGYKAAKEKKNIYAATHSLLLAFLILSIETGIVDLIVWAYLGFIAVFYLIAHNYS